MMDRRLTPFSGRLALESLRGQVTADFVPGEVATVVAPLTDLCAEPNGARDRQVFLGDSAQVIERREGWAFAQMAKDGYCGWLAEIALGGEEQPTHWVSAPATHLYPEANLKARELGMLTMTSRLRVTGESGDWLETTRGFVPRQHVKPLGEWHKDPVAVAQTYLGVPYLWGGNGRAGLDCSGLVQLSLRACGIDCPGDSDMQMKLGEAVAEKKPAKRGDLLFWKGHVALAMNADFILHATAAYMAVAAEPMKAALTRISGSGGGAVLARRRLG
jgi:cell wall-associated NlpC family hydrolase